MAISDTSLETWLNEVYPKLSARQRPVLHYLRNADGSRTNAEIAKALARPINEITPRTNELRKLGLMLDAGRRRCNVTGNTAHAWKAKYPVLPPAFEPKPEKKAEANQNQLL